MVLYGEAAGVYYPLFEYHIMLIEGTYQSLHESSGHFPLSSPCHRLFIAVSPDIPSYQMLATPFDHRARRGSIRRGLFRQTADCWITGLNNTAIYVL